MECQSLPKMFVIVGWINSPLGPYFPCRETVLAWPFLPYVPSSCIHPVRTFKKFPIFDRCDPRVGRLANHN